MNAEPPGWSVDPKGADGSTWRRRLCAFLSRILFLCGRALFRAIVGLKLWRERRRNRVPAWKGYGELLAAHPLFFHYVMFQAPRWNCHAVLGVLRGIEVKDRLAIHFETARRAARSWTVVVYGEGSGTRTETHIGPEQGADRERFHEVHLRPGIYSLGVRYYECGDQAQWPAVRVDGVTIPGRPLGDEPEAYARFLHTLRGRDSLFYRAVHYQVIAALREPHRHDPQRLADLVLPVGNPQTGFRYGLVPKGAQIRIEVPRAWLDESLLYLTVLNVASLPSYWTRVEESPFTSPAMAMDGLYLVRVQAGPGQAGSAEGLTVRILAPGDV